MPNSFAVMRRLYLQSPRKDPLKKLKTMRHHPTLQQKLMTTRQHPTLKQKLMRTRHHPTLKQKLMTTRYYPTLHQKKFLHPPFLKPSECPSHAKEVTVATLSASINPKKECEVSDKAHPSSKSSDLPITCFAKTFELNEIKKQYYYVLREVLLIFCKFYSTFYE